MSKSLEPMFMIFRKPFIVLICLFVNTLFINAQDILHPNVIIVMTDDQGYGDIAALGNEIIKTPNIDALHKVSASFTDYHVSPTCAPTRVRPLAST